LWDLHLGEGSVDAVISAEGMELYFHVAPTLAYRSQHIVNTKIEVMYQHANYVICDRPSQNQY